MIRPYNTPSNKGVFSHLLKSSLNLIICYFKEKKQAFGIVETVLIDVEPVLSSLDVLLITPTKYPEIGRLFRPYTGFIYKNIGL